MSDSGLTNALAGLVIGSETSPGVQYRLVSPLGEGGMGVAFYAVREAPEGVTPAVLKVVKPDIVGTAGPTALLMIQKEAIALGRLNERVPPTPFVVRFMDTGSVVLTKLHNIELPWIAVEYVHGGVEGTTLEQRVIYSVENTRYAFDAARAERTIECLAEGLVAIHDVGVIHRDLTPGNVLCCGFGANEVPKIADFGIARPAGIQATFGYVLLGTPGYAAPEQSFSSEGDVGPWTDVFSFACLIFFALTGELYFDANNFAKALLLQRDTKRRSILEATALSPELRDQPALCRSIDQILAHATAINPTHRLPDARVLARSLLPLLHGANGVRSQRASERLVASMAGQGQTEGRLTWTVRHPPGDDRLVRSVAWDGDGHCLAVTTDGLHYWNGTNWLPARAGRLDTSALRSVSLLRPGAWFLSGEGGLLATLTPSGEPRILQAPPDASFTLATGDPDDLAVVVAEQNGSAPMLYSMAAGRLFRPRSLDGVRTVTSLARLDDARWLVVGRTTAGAGFAAIHSAVSFDTAFLPTPRTDALTAASGHLDRGFGIAAGRSGVAVRFDGANTTPFVLDDTPDLACAGMDVQGRAWVGAAGRLWSQQWAARAPWLLAWEDPSWTVPFVSLRADVGVVTAMTVDGAVLEGRMI
ncbi:MAG TPA: serine/threonine-protein kinase [Polyangiaceae bacterium]|nr:serine/threonine-protein kinase [Polyangiaceae bacterium]